MKFSTIPGPGVLHGWFAIIGSANEIDIERCRGSGLFEGFSVSKLWLRGRVPLGKFRASWFSSKTEFSKRFW